MLTYVTSSISLKSAIVTAFYMLGISFSVAGGFSEVVLEKFKELLRHPNHFLKVHRIIGLDFDRRAISENPALQKAEARPV